MVTWSNFLNPNKRVQGQGGEDHCPPLPSTPHLSTSCMKSQSWEHRGNQGVLFPTVLPRASAQARISFPVSFS